MSDNACPLSLHVAAAARRARFRRVAAALLVGSSLAAAFDTGRVQAADAGQGDKPPPLTEQVRIMTGAEPGANRNHSVGTDDAAQDDSAPAENQQMRARPLRFGAGYESRMGVESPGGAGRPGAGPGGR